MWPIRRAPWLVAAMVVAVALGGAAFRVWGPEDAFGHAGYAMADFQSVAYLPTRAFLDGINPYSTQKYLADYPADHPFTLYLPATLALHLPFGIMSPGGANLTYMALTIGMTVLLAFLAYRYNRLPANGALVLLTTGLILLSLPGHQNFLLGNVTVPLVIATYIAIRHADVMPFVSGMGVAVSLLKPNFGLPLAVLMLLRGQWRAVLWAAALTAAINLPLMSVLASRSGGLGPFLHEVASTWRGVQTIVYNSPSMSLRRIDAIALISRITGTSLGAVGQWLVSALVLVLGALALRGLGREKPGEESSGREAVATGVICVTMLLSVYHQSYDTLLLILPLVAVVADRLPVPAQLPGLRPKLLGLMALLALNYASTESIVSALQSSRAIWVLLASINSVALVLMFYLYVRLALLAPTRAVAVASSADA